MNFNEGKEKVKTWARDNKGKIILGLGVVAGAIVIGAIASKTKKLDELTDVTPEPVYEHDYGKDLEIHYVDPENGEVLWKDLCTEEYVNDMKDWGMQFENIRMLNNIEEEA